MEILALVIVGAWIIEMSLSGIWAPFYFRYGVPLFVKTCSYSKEPETLTNPITLDQLYEGSWGPSTLFQSLGPGETAFRQKVFEYRILKYLPLMHGIVRRDRSRQVMTVTGYANWWPILMVALLPVFAVEATDAEELIATFIGALLMFGVIYLIQYRLFSKIFEKVKSDYSTHVAWS